MTPMERYKHFKMKIDLIPEDIIEEYNLRSKVSNRGYIHCKARQGMYGHHKQD